MATSYSSYVDEYDATCGYDVEISMSKAVRFVAAVRGMLRFASVSNRGDVSMEHDPNVLQAELNRALAWIAANPTDAQLLLNPSVVHADFSGFGQYGGGPYG